MMMTPGRLAWHGQDRDPDCVRSEAEYAVARSVLINEELGGSTLGRGIAAYGGGLQQRHFCGVCELLASCHA